MIAIHEANKFIRGLALKRNATRTGVIKKVVRRSKDELSDNSEPVQRERTVGKSFALLKKDLENIELIKDKCLGQKVALNDSHAIRLALSMAAELSATALAKANSKITKPLTGRPKGS